MSVSVERLRVWLLAGAGLLLMVIAAFLGYAHYRAHRFLRDLPKKLGVDVRRETNGFTYSQSLQGKTVYTIHAAKAVEHGDGKVALHDVGIVLYGRKQDRADRIYGSEFEYDQTAGVIRAVGEVHIDLQAPEAADANAKMDYAAGKDLHKPGVERGGHEGKDERLIHVTTSGLVFMQKLGVAATDNDLEFESGGLTGHAVGADYNSDSGVVVLHSAVRVNGLEHDKPVVLTASRAELDRPNERVLLTQAKDMAVAAGGGEGQTARAQHVVMHLRPDGSAERVEAEGDVTLVNGAGGTVTGPRGEMILNAQNQVQSGVMSGGVKYSLDDALRKAQGEAAEGRVVFDKAGHPDHVVMTGAVHLHERVRASDTGTEPWSERELNAGAVELALDTDKTGTTLIRDAKATGDARLKVLNPDAKGSGMVSSALAGEILTAHFVRAGNADHIAEVHGDGHTTIRRVSATGVVNTSSGDSLVAHFHPVVAGVGGGASLTGKASQHGSDGGDAISNATEQGHVVMTQVPVKKPGDTAAPVEERVTAARAIYDGALERTTLTGDVQVSDGTSILWADRVVTEQQSGDATADGSVKASYGQPGSTDEPVHVLAARAELKHDSQVAKFYGVPGRPARLWQGASQVDAPVLEFEQKQRRLLAHGEGQGAPTAVHTVLVGGGASAKASGSKAGKPSGGSGKTDVVRVVSRELVYSDEARRADFTGVVQVESADGSLRGQQVVVYLQAAAVKASQTGGARVGASGVAVGKNASGGAVGGGFMGGSVERIVANGHIEMQQPGRRATGEQLVYTASDGMFVLTGTSAAMPKVVDDLQGTVTGTSLRFHAGDENVVVSNGGESGAGQRVRTETQVKNKQ
jgi:lipopolysaccharide export system protein LptA